ncbi:26S proteasome non-ATPase regulatory subunit 6-like [Prorops nasuta]|uniref:26S proteasome non-ATPase regulatory subunit 6-like n=1 Tax=Prorops nasuta TaxID=863751 RepID=UPI0034CDE570
MDAEKGSEETPDYMLLPKLKFKLGLSKYRDDAKLKQSLLNIIEKNHMAHFYEEICKEFKWKIDNDLLDAMYRANAVVWEELESRVVTTQVILDLDNLYTFGQGNWRERLEFAFSTGNLERAIQIALSVIENEKNLSSSRAEAAFTIFRIAYFKNNITEMGKAIKIINNLLEGSCTSGSEWCCRNKSKVYQSIYCLATRNFSRAALLLLDCISTFESYELLPFKDVVEYTVLASMISLDRSELDKLLNNNGTLQQALIENCLEYKEYLSCFYGCRYAEFFERLAWIENEMKCNPILRPHYSYYVREMRIRAYNQLLQVYRVLGLAKMAEEFNVAKEYIEEDLVRFIANGRIHCKIDKVSNTVVTVSSAGCERGQAPSKCCDRGTNYSNTIKKGDNFYKMAHRALMGIMSKKPRKVMQRFKYLLVMDFEATCQEVGLLKPQEIIEFPCLALSTSDWEVKSLFHHYVKPRIHPQLTSFCTELTGIMQETVEEEPYFPEVFAKFCSWLDKEGFLKDPNESAFVTCGDWDLKVMLPNQCELDNISLPNKFNEWINLKASYCQAMNYYPRSLKDMLNRLKLPTKGPFHSGIFDAKNMVQIIQAIAEKKLIFDITSKLDAPSSIQINVKRQNV